MASSGGVLRKVDFAFSLNVWVFFLSPFVLGGGRAQYFHRPPPPPLSLPTFLLFLSFPLPSPDVKAGGWSPDARFPFFRSLSFLRFSSPSFPPCERWNSGLKRRKEERRQGKGREREKERERAKLPEKAFLPPSSSPLPFLFPKGKKKKKRENPALKTKHRFFQTEERKSFKKPSENRPLERVLSFFENA